MQTELLEKKQLLADIWQFEFKRPHNFEFIAGDFTELELGDESHGGARWLTIASAPHDDKLTFITKIPAQPSVFKKYLSEMQHGHVAWLSPALGMFHIPKDESKKLLFIAAGLGITPYRSILSQLNYNQDTRDIQLLYWAKPDQHLQLPDYDKSANVKKIMTDEIAFELSSIKDLVPDWRSRIIYLSGPEPICLKLYKDLRDLGIPIHQIKLDYFEGYYEI